MKNCFLSLVVLINFCCVAQFDRLDQLRTIEMRGLNGPVESIKTYFECGKWFGKYSLTDSTKEDEIRCPEIIEFNEMGQQTYYCFYGDLGNIRGKFNASYDSYGNIVDFVEINQLGEQLEYHFIRNQFGVLLGYNASLFDDSKFSGEIIYAENGKKSTETIYHQGILVERIVVRYNEEEIPQKQTNIFGNGTGASTKEIIYFIYDSQNRLIRERGKNTVVNYSYDQEGRLTSVKASGLYSTIPFMEKRANYDTQGKIIYEVELSDGKPIKSLNYQYDETSNKLIYLVERNELDKEVVSTYKCYDEQDYLIEETVNTLSASGEITFLFHFRYQNDFYGNWIVRESLIPGGTEIKEVRTREIKYYTF